MNAREVAEKMIVDANLMVIEGNARLADLDKPKRKLGDVVTFYGETRIILFDEDGDLCSFDENGKVAGMANGPFYKKTDRNIFAELKLNSKDLKNFTVFECDGSRDSFSAKISAKRIEISCDDGFFPIEKAKEICQKLGQMIATAERDEIKRT